MAAIDRSHARGREVVFGLAFFLLVAGTANADSVREITHRLYKDHSYILIEYPNKPARLLLLSESPDPLPLTPGDQILKKALFDLAHSDPNVREDALLRLADSNANDTFDLLTSALADPSPDVRDTAAAILEGLSKE